MINFFTMTPLKTVRVVFGGGGVTIKGTDPTLGKCCFNGSGKTVNPVKSTDTPMVVAKTTKPADVKKVVEKVVLTKAQLKNAIERKMIESGMTYTKEFHRDICKLNRDPLEAYLNDESNFVKPEVKEANAEAEKNAAQVEKDKEHKNTENPMSDEEKKKTLISKITLLQSEKNTENPMSAEELSEMSLDSLDEYNSDLSI